LGQTRFLLVLLVSSVTGSLLHALLHPHSLVPLIGASGAISGMLVCYGLQFPMARIGFLIRLPSVFFMRWVNLPAWAYVLFWIALQAIGVFRQAAGITQVSLAAHLGGAATGFLFWFFLPESRAPATDSRSTA
jgi:membrane associated rhomboid family serine protease